MTEPQQWGFGPFRLDATTGCLWRGDELVDLSPKPLALLSYLVGHAGAVVSKEDLLDAVWPETAVSEGVLTTNMGLIRQMLGESAQTPTYITTVRGRGYRFIAPVTQLMAQGPTPATISETGSEPFGAEGLAVRAPIIGREAELAQLQKLLERALQGQRQLIWITGEPGIGKTTLVDAWVAHLTSGGQIRHARGQCIAQYGAGEAYLPLLEALDRLGRGEAQAQVVKVLTHQAPIWLSHLPALGDAQHREPGAGVQGTVSRERMLRELVDAIETLSREQPLILVLEDLHWSDVSTVKLAQLCRAPTRCGAGGDRGDLPSGRHDHPSASHSPDSPRASAPRS
ncbi:hypothetical protein C2W62_21120 [Candidatus Entotheonella serta]|nr:hypothetical protein C2W62_21120 [Candidatus Entotheonella serta]